MPAVSSCPACSPLIPHLYHRGKLRRSAEKSRVEGVEDDRDHVVVLNLCMEMHWTSQENCLSMADDKGGNRLKKWRESERRFRVWCVCTSAPKCLSM